MNGDTNGSATLATPGAGWTNGDVTVTALYPYTRQGQLARYAKHRRWIGLSSAENGWTRIGDGEAHDARHSKSSSSTAATKDVVWTEKALQEEAASCKALLAQLCQSFYECGWATGTGGGLSLRVGGPSEGRPFRVFVAPSGLQKEDLIADDMFTLDMDRHVLEEPVTKGLKQSACTPLWYVVYQHRPSARCVIHTHSQAAVLATLLDPTETAQHLELTHLEMLKGVGGHAYDDVLQVPIIDNRPSEDLLAEQLEAAVLQYPRANAVLVRRHGLYVWGDSWQQAKTQGESFDYLFETAVQMHRMGLSANTKPTQSSYRVNEDNIEEDNGSNNKKRKANETLETDGFRGASASVNDMDLVSSIPLLPRDAKTLLLDIEGCTTSISFVHETLFPYVRQHLEAHLSSLEATARDALAARLRVAVLEVQATTQVDAMSCHDLVIWLMDRDVKAAALKDLQGTMWKAGYAHGTLQGHVYPDVPLMLQWMKQQGVPVYIYSSGSVAAQKLLFGHSVAGNLLPLLAGHFDIPTAGPKTQVSSYQHILRTLGLAPNQLVFLSDLPKELQAAREAGVTTVVTLRPGNATLAPHVAQQYPPVHSLLQVCGA